MFVQGGGAGAHEADAPLAASLKAALGKGFAPHYPRMPEEENPQIAAWAEHVATQCARLEGPLILVGHSLGGTTLLRALAEDQIKGEVSSLYLLAVPARDGADWDFEDLAQPADLARRLASIPHLALYHCRDDEVVPFAHLALHAKQLSRAVVRPRSHGGHQFGEDLGFLAQDILRDDTG
ncbi:alpha/beta hydrolase [Niveibacterium sp. SC-1]|uniref:alpha/beta hydrolase n=1 Tax=Niveibacterium sp. SC-1 TaxID=3135646 RepID=UPI00311EF347